MNSEAYLWAQAVVAVFLGLLMIANYFRYKQKMFKYLFLVFCLIIIKSFVYNEIHLTDVKWVEEIREGNVYRLLDPSLRPLYEFKYFIFQCLEILFAILLAYSFILIVKKAENKKTNGVKTFGALQAGLVLILLGLVCAISVQYGDKTTFKTDVSFVEFLKGSGIFIFVFWKIIVLCMAWVSIAKGLNSYFLNEIRIIKKYKMLVYFFLLIEILFALFSLPGSYYTHPTWFIVQVFSLILLSFFAFGNQTGFIESIQEKIVELTKEKNTIISFMKEISTLVGSGDFDLDTVVAAIVNDSVKGTNARGGAALLKDPLTNKLLVKYVSGFYPPTKPVKSSPGIVMTETMIVDKFKAERIGIGEGLLGTVVEKGQAIYIPDAMQDEKFVQTVPDVLRVSSFLAVPLRTKDDVFGVLSVVDDSKMFLEGDLSFLETLGEQAAITIKQIQMYQEILEKKQAEKEIGVAGEIQNSLIPHTFPDTNKYEIYGFSIPAKGVGGDYYDYIDFGDNKIAMTMFDVSGKGVPASLIMVMIRTTLRAIASLNQDTKDVLYKLNNTIAEEIFEDRYATGFYLLFDAEKGIMSYSNAGHGPMMVYRTATDTFEFMDTEGMPVGIMSNIEYGQNYSILERGDIGILYTDGITEAMNLAHEEFGMDRFKEIVKKNKRESSKEIANKVLEAVTRFMGTAPQHDDETLLVLKFK
jgi:sigma-B regulation protein RsbU (phosphoserine phosphatase)